jgi:hypothetical protein
VTKPSPTSRRTTSRSRYTARIIPRRRIVGAGTSRFARGFALLVLW